MMTNTELLELFLMNKESGFNWRERRHEAWTEIYQYYRDTVITNRLTQRQSVNIPLMKSTVKSLLKDIDDAPMLYFKNIDNDSQREVYYNSYWEHRAVRNKLKIRDIVDKKQVLLFGRSFKQLNICNGKFTFDIADPQDILLDRYADPADIDSGRFLIREHIYMPLRKVVENENYDKDEIAKLISFLATEKGLNDSNENAQDAIEKNDRMRSMGVEDVDQPTLGEAYVEVNDGFMYVKDSTAGMDIIYYMVVVNDKFVMQAVPQHIAIGKTSDDFWMDHYAFTSWGEDVERTDVWNDGVGDIVRTPNRILNAWYSQEVENRTLKNLGMRYYNSDNEDFEPQTFEPTGWGWYPIPGNPNDMIKDVEIPDLSDTLEHINFLMQVCEKATAATAAQQGAVETRNITLGEVQIAIANAKERVQSMATLYTDSWEEFGLKYTKLMEAAGDMIDPTKITKSGREGRKMYTKLISSKDWQTLNGYTVEVQDIKSREMENATAIEKLQALKSIMPANKKLEEIYKKKGCEFAGLTATETKEVLDAEKQMQNQLLNPMTQPGLTQPGAVPNGMPMMGNRPAMQLPAPVQ